MNVASLELCKELYELSGRTWHEEIIYSWHKDDGEYVIEDFWTGSICPAYDLGYLLRKMPGYTLDYNGNAAGAITCGYLLNNHGDYVFGSGNTPEDAACKLAIELFKQGILT